MKIPIAHTATQTDEDDNIRNAINRVIAENTELRHIIEQFCQCTEISMEFQGHTQFCKLTPHCTCGFCDVIHLQCNILKQAELVGINPTQHETATKKDQSNVRCKGEAHHSCCGDAADCDCQ